MCCVLNIRRYSVQLSHPAKPLASYGCLLFVKLCGGFLVLLCDSALDFSLAMNSAYTVEQLQASSYDDSHHLTYIRAVSQEMEARASTKPTIFM